MALSYLLRGAVTRLGRVLAMRTYKPADPSPRSRYDKADWKKGREELSTRITYDSSLSALSTKDNLEGTVDRLVAVFVGVLKENVARV